MCHKVDVQQLTQISSLCHVSSSWNVSETCQQRCHPVTCGELFQAETRKKQDSTVQSECFKGLQHHRELQHYELD